MEAVPGSMGRVNVFRAGLGMIAPLQTHRLYVQTTHIVEANSAANASMARAYVETDSLVGTASHALKTTLGPRATAFALANAIVRDTVLAQE